MKTVIIYRANQALDSRLCVLKDKVDYFIRIDPKEFKEYGVSSYEFQCIIGNHLESLGPINEPVKVFTDLTCAPALSQEWDVNIISQEEGQLQEWVRMIAEEGKEIILVLENLADHVNLDGVDPYRLPNSERAIGGDYHSKVLAVWESCLKDKSVAYSVVNINDLYENRPNIDEVVIVCDHHCANCLEWLSERNNYRSAFRANTKPLVRLEDLDSMLF